MNFKETKVVWWKKLGNISVEEKAKTNHLEESNEILGV
jgi:hypothetical protein